MIIDFKREIFYPIKNQLNSKFIPDLLNNFIIKSRVNSNYDIVDISSLDNLRKNSLLLIKKSTKNLNINDFVHVITNNNNLFDEQFIKDIHLVSDLEKSYNLLINHMYYHEDQINVDDDYMLINNSKISKFANIDKSAFIGNNCIISRGVKIGKNCILKNNVIIKNSLIEDDVSIGDNTVIGSTGFGFDLKNMGSNNLTPQIGIVYVDKNVRIGSNCSIDRGKIDYTYIGKNTMLDNQIHIAHNVILGSNVCIAAQCGISGSTTLGNNIIMGGQSGIAGHLKIGNNVVIAAKSGVTKNIKDNSIVAGFPAVDIKEWKKNIIKLKKYGYKQN